MHENPRLGRVDDDGTILAVKFIDAAGAGVGVLVEPAVGSASAPASISARWSAIRSEMK